MTEQEALERAREAAAKDSEEHNCPGMAAEYRDGKADHLLRVAVKALLSLNPPEPEKEPPIRKRMSIKVQSDLRLLGVTGPLEAIAFSMVDDLLRIMDADPGEKAAWVPATLEQPDSARAALVTEYRSIIAAIRRGE